MKSFLNSFLYFKEYYNYVIIYVPYKHTILRFSKDIWKKIKAGKIKSDFLFKKKILVNKDYESHFLTHYKTKINEKKPELKILYLILTDYCNLRCPYCFVEENYLEQKRDFMDWNFAKKIIDYFLKNANEKERQIIFYGGEPTLNLKILKKSIEYIRKKSKEIKLTINTNGTHYEKGFSNFLLKNNIQVSISIDGFSEINDRTRIDIDKKGISSKLFKNIADYIKDGVNVSLSITINSFNIDYLPVISKFVVNKFKGVKAVGFNIPLEHKNGNNLMVNSRKVSILLYQSFRILRNNKIYEDRIMRRLKKIVQEKVYFQDCGACGNQLVAHPQGIVGPCHGFLGSKKFFTRFEGFDFKNSKIIKEWNKISPINKEYCSSIKCPFILICGNSCPYYSDITKGSINEIDERMYDFLEIMIQNIAKDIYLKKPKFLMIKEKLLKEIGTTKLLEHLIEIKKKYGLKVIILTEEKNINLNNFIDKKVSFEKGIDFLKQNKPEDFVYITDDYKNSRQFLDLGIRDLIVVKLKKESIEEIGNGWIKDLFEDYFKMSS